MRKKTSAVQLFWVYDSSHVEDWFVVARTREEARWGLYDGEPDSLVRCRRICELPMKRLPEAPYVQLDLLVRLGFKVIHEHSPRVVWKDGVLYREGSHDHPAIGLREHERGGVYIIHLRGTYLYKVGMTSNIHQRLRALRLNNPGEIELEAFFHVARPRNFEWILKDHLKEYRYSREWYLLNGESVAHVIRYANELARSAQVPSSGSPDVPELKLDEHLAELERKYTKLDPRPEHPFDLKYRILPYIAHPFHYEEQSDEVYDWARSYHESFGQIKWPTREDRKPAG